MERKNYLDFLKGIAIFAVIIIHVTSEGFSRNLPSDDLFWYSLFYVITKCAVPLFVMVTGVLLLNPRKELSIKKIYSKYILNIVVAAFIWGIVYKLIRVITTGGISENGGIFTVLKSFLIGFFTGSLEFHFWYVYALIGIYIALPILRAFVKSADKRTLEYFIIVWIIINGLLVLTQGGYFEFLSVVSNNFHFVGIFVSYIGYTILGYYLDKYEMNKIQKIVIIIAGLVGLLSCGFMTIYDNLTFGNARIEYTNPICPGIIVYAIMVFMIFKNMNIKYCSLFSKVVCRIGKNTLGIYFMHMILIIVFIQSGLVTDLIYAPIDIIIYAVVTLLISWAIQELLGRIPVIGKWL